MLWLSELNSHLFEGGASAVYQAFDTLDMHNNTVIWLPWPYNFGSTRRGNTHQVSHTISWKYDHGRTTTGEMFLSNPVAPDFTGISGFADFEVVIWFPRMKVFSPDSADKMLQCNSLQNTRHSH